MAIMGGVQDPGEVQRYLRHMGMREHPPPIRPARYVQAELAYDDCTYEDTFSEQIKCDAPRVAPVYPKPP